MSAGSVFGENVVAPFLVFKRVNGSCSALVMAGFRGVLNGDEHGGNNSCTGCKWDIHCLAKALNGIPALVDSGGKVFPRIQVLLPCIREGDNKSGGCAFGDIVVGAEF